MSETLVDLRPRRELIDANFDGYKLTLDSLPLYRLNFSGGKPKSTIFTHTVGDNEGYVHVSDWLFSCTREAVLKATADAMSRQRRKNCSVGKVGHMSCPNPNLCSSPWVGAAGMGA